MSASGGAGADGGDGGGGGKLGGGGGGLQPIHELPPVPSSALLPTDQPALASLVPVKKTHCT